MGGSLGNLWLLVPPWIFGVAITLLGRWGERHLLTSVAGGTERPRSSRATWIALANVLFVNLVFFSLLPTVLLMMFQPMLPFLGARAGLALAVAAFLFGIVPARLLDAPRRGWSHAFYLMLVDFVRIAGALTLIGWLLTR